MSRRHELKCWSEVFGEVRSGAKTFECRWNDRDYARGDILELREFDPIANAYTGEVEERLVTYVSGEAEEKFGVGRGYVVLAIAPASRGPLETPPADPDALIAWHETHVENARLRADGWRSAGADHPVQKVRFDACARAGDDEALFHAAAARLIRTLVASVRLLAAGAPDHG